MSANDPRQEVISKGFTVAENVFSTDEITRLREVLQNYFKHGDYLYLFGGKTRPDAFNAPLLKDIRWILKNERLVHCIKQILGESLKFCNHSDVHCNLIGGLHKDNYGADDFSMKNGHEYGVIKAAIYLNDYSGPLSDGYALRVKEGSHRTRTLEAGKTVDIRTRQGDVILFDCRITHIGEEDILSRNLFGRALRRSFRFFTDEKKRFFIRHLYRNCLGMPDRLAIFCAFGKTNLFTEEHIQGNVKRQNEQNRSHETGPCAEVTAYLKSAGINQSIGHERT